MEWKEVTLGEVSSKIGDGLHGTPKYDDEGSYYFINGNNLNCGKIIIKDDTKRVGIEEFVKNQKELNEQTILVSINGTIGNVAKYNNEPCILGKSACYINVVKEVDKEFIYYVLTSANFKRNITNEATGTTIKNVSLKQMREYKFNIPCNISYQHRIASILSSLDRKIELNNKINADLEEMAQAIFKNWFVDFEPFKDGKFVDSELGMIPEGWKVGTLGDITKNKSAKVKERNDVKVLSPVTTGELVLSEEYFTKQVFSSSIAKYKIVNKGDFAYNPARVNIGSLGRNEFDFDGCVSPVYVVFSVLDGYENYFDLFRKTDFFKDSVASLAIGGVRQSLSYDDLSLIETIIPSENVVEKFNNLYNQMKKTIKAKKLENSRLSTLRDTLLPRLMSGEIEVPE
ncbi:MAG: restriction endonuclease subunit S [Prevotella pectinovora]|uniref:restriction endonuclease subunit S n=1 Tax=Prevotella pectinovora TaxID=1602169 RepID=UPI002E77A71B|nr:restriction endonuclease subunit S [Prevotella pectinovora]MEE1547850.1 restriction endonuclease subunit S [Prevotella pectinovora]